MAPDYLDNNTHLEYKGEDGQINMNIFIKNESFQGLPFLRSANSK